uniref:Uncharacterized protein n=1 Tax=Tetraselmis sp. GSL018 TaxID=582737 RepID=A0A061QSQ9_9CHLO
MSILLIESLASKTSKEALGGYQITRQISTRMIYRVSYHVEAADRAQRQNELAKIQ